MSMPSRNEPCPCGSGKKFKLCHIDNLEGLSTGRSGRDPIPYVLAGLGVVGGAVLMSPTGLKVGLAVAGGGIMLAVGYSLFRDPPSSKGGGDPGAINVGG